MDSFDEQLQKRLQARADAEAEEKRKVDEQDKIALERAERSATIVRGSAGIVFKNIAESLRIRGLEAESSVSSVEKLATIQHQATATLEVKTKTGPQKRGRIIATKHPQRDTINLNMSPNFGAIKDVEFEHTNKAGIEQAVQGWVLDLLDN
ncbi:hypothetical protein E7T09_13015 [Deinococcus sp. KSM4-11]|uniref:hypothetical protein n=1 Tax=Deinococcus sp. KSM4-11 TaxID=2568654 RepID=UPI0010A588F6|nr:hypothetical protein [Deinococcus sp. KSM4-11]THF86145.1 hypothetical protein E7T09_13015 [Deinococcus sp. KSM4-11]